MEDTGERELAILKAILAVLQERPFYGYRKVYQAVKDTGTTLKQVRRIMRKAGLRAIYAGRKTSIPAKGHARYPYLLRDKAIWLPNQVWATDIPCVRLRGGYVYLVAIIDLYSRKVLSWRSSNTMEAEFCVAALEEAIAVWGWVPPVSGALSFWILCRLFLHRLYHRDSRFPSLSFCFCFFKVDPRYYNRC